MFPNSVPITRATGHARGFHSFIHICLPEFPKRNPPTSIQEKHKVTVHGDGRPTYSEVRPGSRRGSLMILLSPHPSATQRSARQLPPCSGQTRAPLTSMCCSNRHHGVPSTTVTASHVTQGSVEYESKIPQGMDEGLDLWEANQLFGSLIIWLVGYLVGYHFVPWLFCW